MMARAARTAALYVAASFCFTSAAEGRDVGLLLGLCPGDGECRTLWIAAEEGAWALRAEGSGLIVPRRSGFWRIALAPPVDERDWFDWRIGAGPADRPVSVQPTIEPERVEALRRGGGVRSMRIVFAGPEHVAVDETFETHGWPLTYNRGFAMYSIDAWAKTPPFPPPLSIADVLGESAAVALATAARRTLDDLDPDSEERELFDGDFLDGVGTSWTLARQRGRVVVAARSGTATGVLRGYYFDYDTAIDVPASVLGGAAPKVRWELVVEEIPDAFDAFASPAGDVMMVLSPGRLLVCPQNAEGAPGPPLATIPIPEGSGPVVAQWALGAHVQRWTQTLTPLLADGH